MFKDILPLKKNMFCNKMYLVFVYKNQTQEKNIISTTFQYFKLLKIIRLYRTIVGTFTDLLTCLIRFFFVMSFPCKAIDIM